MFFKGEIRIKQDTKSSYLIKEAQLRAITEFISNLIWNKSSQFYL